MSFEANLGVVSPLRKSNTFPIQHHIDTQLAHESKSPAATTVQAVIDDPVLHKASPRRPPLPGSTSEYKRKKGFPRISKPVETIRRQYDVVVIGSGYGGGVAASRMARGGQLVAVLELGKEKWPGEYPENLNDARHELHLSGDFSTRDLGPMPVAAGEKTGLYHLILGEGQNAFVGNGLGGTSLLNANVFLPADERTMKLSAWPKEIREKPDCLQPYYERARSMLEPQAYPTSFPKLPKLDLLERQAQYLGYGDKFRRVEQTTWFREDGLNSSGVRMKRTKLTGMDSTGVNDGSKSSTLMNYLADAWNWGAEIFTRCEVRYIKKNPKGGYTVFFAWHGAHRDKFGDTFYDDLMWVHAKKMVFLGAGALGTSEILLRSKQMGLSMSESVGQNMSGNGDLLAFGYNLNTNVNGLARPDPRPDAPIGPTITGVIDCRDEGDDALDGFVIEEGVIPKALANFMQFMLEVLPGRQKPAGLMLQDKLTKIVASLMSRFLGAYNKDGSLERTQTYLIMCHDDNQAVLTLKNNKPNLQFIGVGRSEYVEKLNKKLRDATNAFNGTFVNNPFFSLNAQSEITVHPIGGASMSSDGTGDFGVCTHLGEVYSGQGTAYHEGLVVCDGSLVPTALGANPFATITALAERSVEQVSRKFGIDIDYTTKNRELDFWGKPEFNHHAHRARSALNEEFVEAALRSDKEGYEFTEIMTGHIHAGNEIEDFELAERAAHGLCQGARFFLSNHAYDVSTSFSSNDSKNLLTGTFSCGALPASPYMIVGGDFRPFVDDESKSNTKNFIYDFDMTGTDGSTIHLHGKKIINNKAAFSVTGMWKATTTVQVVLTSVPHDKEPSEILGRGILHIRPNDFISELKSFTASARNTFRFLSFFLKNIASIFFAPLGYLTWPVAHFDSWSAKNGTSHVFPVTSIDGVTSKLKVWNPLSVVQRDMELLFVGGAAVDDSIFALPTVEENAIHYWRKKGYRCWCIIHRVGKCDNAEKNWTTYDARLDIAAAVDKIDKLRETNGYGPLAKKTYIIAHCAGSIATSAGLLDGDINPSSICGITASQVFMHPKFPVINRWKASIPFATNAWSALARRKWYDCVPQATDSFFQHFLDQLLRFYPLWRKDICNSTVCHRSSFIFGLLWSHEKLNHATHQNLHKYIGGTTMQNQSHLIKMGLKGRVLRANGDDCVVTTKNIERLRGIPILFLYSQNNSVYDPENTGTSYGELRTQLNEEDYRREPLENYGHLDCWMSDESCEDVFPKVDAHLNHIGKRLQEKQLNAYAANGRRSGPAVVNRLRATSRAETDVHAMEIRHRKA